MVEEAQSVLPFKALVSGEVSGTTGYIWRDD